MKVSRNYSDENGCSPSPTGDTRIVMKCIQNMGVIGFFITTGDGSTVVSWSTTLSLWGQIQRRTPSYMLTCKVGLKPHLNIDTSTMNSSSPIVLFTNTYLPFRGAFWMGNIVKVNKKNMTIPCVTSPFKFRNPAKISETALLTPRSSTLPSNGIGSAEHLQKGMVFTSKYGVLCDFN